VPSLKEKLSQHQKSLENLQRKKVKNDSSSG
jgi:hypothetical protein